VHIEAGINKALPPFPKSVEEGLGLRPVWKQFKADVDQRLKPLQKITDGSNKEMTKRLQKQQEQFMNAMNKTLANPGSVSQSSAMQVVAVPMFAEKMNARENMVLENLQKRKQALQQQMIDFIKGDGVKTLSLVVTMYAPILLVEGVAAMPAIAFASFAGISPLETRLLFVA